jgi:PAS domain-containing protein
MGKLLDPEVLVRNIYGAVLDDGCFAASIARLGPYFRSHVNALHSQDYAFKRSELDLTGVLNAHDLSSFLDDYARRWSGKNLWIERSLPGLLDKGYSDGEEVVPARELYASEYYTHFLVPLGIRYGAGIRLSRSGEALTSVASFNRSASQGPFTRREHAMFARLQPHLANAYRIHLRVEAVMDENRSLRAGFDTAPVALFVLDLEGRVLAHNARAGAVLEGGALRLSASGFSRTLHAYRAAEKHALEAALAKFRENPAAPDVQTVVLRPDPLRVEAAHVLQLIHIPVRGALWGKGGRLLAVVVPLERIASDKGLSVLRLAFGATPSEARLAQALWKTGQLDAAATLLAVAPSTARSHLKSLFRKTGTHQQAELVRLVDRLLAHASAV